MVWTHGRCLEKCHAYKVLSQYSDNECTFTYNADGIRTSKTHTIKNNNDEIITSKTTNFVLNGTKILSQSDDTNTIHFQYGANGVEGFELHYMDNETPTTAQFIYQKNIFGDIIGIFDSNGNQIAKYYYDAWGNCEIVVDNTPQSAYNTNIAQINPFRYRGYYYDVETGFYYLNSRYYDPALGRFINADDISYSNASLLNGLNLYAYCGNNPVNNVDPTGNFLIGLLLGLGLLAGAIYKGIKSYNDGNRGWNLFGDILLGASFGLAAVGLIISVGAAFTGVVAMFAGVEGVTFLGLPVLQAFAIGALAYDFTAFVVAPIAGIKMIGIEVDTNQKKDIPTINPYEYSAIINGKDAQRLSINYLLKVWRFLYGRI